MARLLSCTCSLGCRRAATQEDLLCDGCRKVHAHMKAWGPGARDDEAVETIITGFDGGGDG